MKEGEYNEKIYHPTEALCELGFIILTMDRCLVFIGNIHDSNGMLITL